MERVFISCYLCLPDSRSLLFASACMVPSARCLYCLCRPEQRLSPFIACCLGKTLTNNSFDLDIFHSILNCISLVLPFSSVKPTVPTLPINRLLPFLLHPTPRIRYPTAFPRRPTASIPRNRPTTRRIPLTPRPAPPASILLVVSGLSFLCWSRLFPQAPRCD